MGVCGSKQIEVTQNRGMSARPTSQFSTTQFPLHSSSPNAPKDPKIQQNPTIQNGFNVILDNIKQQIAVGVEVNTDLLRSVSSQIVTVSHHGTEQQRKLMCTEFLPRLISIFEERPEMAGREAIIRAISQLARCSRGDAHRLHAAKDQGVVSLAINVIARGCRTEWAYVCMHGCDLLRYLLGNDEDGEKVKQMGAVALLGNVIGFSIQLDADNELVKSAFQALLAIGPDGSGQVFEIVVECMREYFFHSSVVTPALASLMAMSSEPQGAIRVMEQNLVPSIKKALELHQNSTTMRAYGKRIFTNINHFMAMDPLHAQMYYAQVHQPTTTQTESPVEPTQSGRNSNPNGRQKAKDGRDKDAAVDLSEVHLNDSVNVLMNDSMHIHSQELPRGDTPDHEDYEVMSPIVLSTEIAQEVSIQDMKRMHAVEMSGDRANVKADMSGNMNPEMSQENLEMEVGVHPGRMIVSADYEEDYDDMHAEVVQV